MSKIKYLSNANNERLLVECFEPKNPSRTIFFCHGITGCRKGRTLNDNYFQILAQDLENLGFKVVLFDFSGHGESEGNDYDVTLSKSESELETVFNKEVIDTNLIDFVAFSYGATVLTEFLRKKTDIKPRHIVLISPCLYPLESCFLNANSLFGKDIVKDFSDLKTKERGYAVVGAKGFRFGFKMLEECKLFKPDSLINSCSRIKMFSGSDDVILNTDYNIDFCKKYSIKNTWYKASHSLFEEINKVSKDVIKFLIDKEGIK